MATRFIGISEFRDNIVKIAKDSKKHSQRLIILNRSIPVFEVCPLSDKNTALSVAEYKAGKGSGPYGNHKNFLASLHREAKKYNIKK